MKRLVIASAALATVGLLATACGGETTASSGHDMGTMTAAPTGSTAGAPATTAADHNDQDTMFAMMMIPHHRQALEMAKLATDRAASGEVKKLAQQIESAQEPEIEKMGGWLTGWGLQVPSEDMPSMGHDMGGMMSAEDMKELKGKSGGAFDKAFLDMMIKHHEGAVTMAKQEQTSGAYAPAKAMAASIESGQTAEIATMKRLLKGE